MGKSKPAPEEKPEPPEPEAPEKAPTPWELQFPGDEEPES